MACPGFYFCICPDAFLARKQVDRLVAGMSALPETSVFWGDEGLDAKFWDSLTRPGFVTADRVLLVRQAQLLNAETWKKLSPALGVPREGVLPVFFLESVWEKSAPKLPAHIAKLKCLEFAQKQGWAWKNPGLDSRSLPKYVQECAKSKKTTLDAEALEIVCSAMAPDAAAVDAGLDMLILASPPPSGQSRIDASLARQLGAHKPELIIFDFIRHLQAGASVEVWKTLLQESDGGESLLFPLLALLAREARLLWQDLAGEKVYFPPHIAQAKRALAVRLGKRNIAVIFRAAMEAEFSVKTGQRQPRQALEELVAHLGMVFRGGLRS